MRETILAKMAEAIKNSVTAGCVVGLEKKEYEAGLRGRYIKVRQAGIDAESLQPWAGSRYAICLQRCIQGLADWLTREGREGAVEYVIESGDPQASQAARMLSRMIEIPDLAKRYRLGKYSFVQKGPETPWLFAPDYFVWEWQRYDRNAEQDPPTGEWRTTILPLIENRPHVAQYLTEASVNTQAMFNAAYRLIRPDDAI